MNPVFGPVVGTLLLVAACSASPAATSGPESAAPTVSASPAASLLTGASPAAVRSAFIEALGEAGDHAPVFPGTYTTHFLPALTFSVGDEVNLDCSPGFRCRGYVNANSDGWLDLEFGVSRQAELMLIRLDKVYDPGSASALIDPPSDLTAWLQALPGTVVFQSPIAVNIGGLAATAFDVRTAGETQFGLIPGGYGQAGIGPNAIRLILLRVHDHVVLITEWFGEKNTVRDGPATLAWLQPIVDSIGWL